MARSVVDGFNELRGRFPLTKPQTDEATTKIKSIRDFFDDEFVMAERTMTVGSYARGSIIRTERDLDILAVLSYPEYKDRYDNDSPGFLYMVRDALNEEFGSTKVSSKRVAVKLDFSSIGVDVVPCFRRNSGGYFMPNGQGGWMATNPPYHTQFMSAANDQHHDRLRPLVKLLKFWNVVNGHHLSSLHVELIVERVWHKADYGDELFSHLVAETLRCMPGWVQSTFPDPWPDGQAIDSSLKREDRDAAVRLINEDVENARLAEEFRKNGQVEKAFERWSAVFRGQFPAY